MDILHSVLSCLTGSSSDNKPKVKTTGIRTRSETDDRLASDFLTTLLTTDTTDPSLKKTLDETIHPSSWTSTLAQAILHGLENAIRSGTAVGKAAADALAKATHEAYEFAKEHPIYTSILALGVLAVMAPWVLQVLGFGELGPIEGSFAAYWQSLYGDVPAGAVFGYLQRMGMVWH